LVTGFVSGVKGFSGSPVAGNVKIGKKGYCPSFLGRGAQRAQSFRQAGWGSHDEEETGDDVDGEQSTVGVDEGYSMVIGVAEEIRTGMGFLVWESFGCCVFD
jgi:hypothetical protein